MDDTFDPVALAYVAHGNQAVADKKWDKAFHLYTEAVKLDNRMAEAWNNLGHIYQRWNKPEAAVVCFTRACALIPNSPLFLGNLGDVLWELKQYEEAEQILMLAIEANPSGPAAYHDLAMVKVCQGKIAEAIECCDKVLEHAPDAVLAIRARALAYLYSAQYEKGFAAFQKYWVDIFDDETTFPVPQWEGEDLTDKTLYVHCNQGIGDWIQFVRYVPMIKGARQIICDPPPEIVKLFDTCLPRTNNIEFRPMMGGLSTTAQYHANLMCLPHVLAKVNGCSVDELVTGKPYLEFPQATYDLRWPRGNTKKIGIVWGGNPDLTVDSLRSAAVDDFIINLARPGVELYSLQFGDRGREQFSKKYNPLIRDLSSVITDFSDTAGIMRQLDSVVCVDTSCGHLAGALGVDCHLLVRSHNPDWRWVIGRSDSAWYDSMTVHTQKRGEGWTAVLGRVAAKVIDHDFTKS